MDFIRIFFLQDCFLTALLGLLYLLADITWSVGIGDMRGFIRDGLVNRGVACLGCEETAASDGVNLQSFALPAISLVSVQ